MALTVKTLYDGQLGSTAKAVLYTVPSGRSAIVKNTRLVNTDLVPRTVNLYYLRSGLADTNARLVSPSNLSISPGLLVVDDDEITMGVGDKVLGDASVANKIDCVISGVERDA